MLHRWTSQLSMPVSERKNMHWSGWRRDIRREMPTWWISQPNQRMTSSTPIGASSTYCAGLDCRSNVFDWKDWSTVGQHRTDGYTGIKLLITGVLTSLRRLFAKNQGH